MFRSNSLRATCAFALSLSVSSVSLSAVSGELTVESVNAYRLLHDLSSQIVRTAITEFKEDKEEIKKSGTLSDFFNSLKPGKIVNEVAGEASLNNLDLKIDHQFTNKKGINTVKLAFNAKSKAGEVSQVNAKNETLKGNAVSVVTNTRLELDSLDTVSAFSLAAQAIQDETCGTEDAPEKADETLKAYCQLLSDIKKSKTYAELGEKLSRILLKVTSNNVNVNAPGLHITAFSKGDRIAFSAFWNKQNSSLTSDLQNERDAKIILDFSPTAALVSIETKWITPGELKLADPSDVFKRLVKKTVAVVNETHPSELEAQADLGLLHTKGALQVLISRSKSPLAEKATKLLSSLFASEKATN